MILADQIRHFVLINKIAPSKEHERSYVYFRAGDIHTEMGLKNRMPAVCSALDAEKFLLQNNLRLIERSGPKFGSTVEWVFGLK